MILQITLPTIYGNVKDQNGGTDSTCNIIIPPSINGVCGVNNNACTTGNLNDTPDNSTYYLWNCNGINGGTDDTCNKPIPINGVCRTSNNACTMGNLK